MRCSIARVRALSVPACLALLPLAMAGCNKLTPSGTSDTMALLRSGSEKVCVAPDVQASLRGLILPKPDEITDDASAEDKLAAVAKLSFGYTLTTLQQFDKAVAKATCHTTVEMRGVGNGPTKARVTYEVTPAADNPNSFIVTASTDEVQAYAKLMVAAALHELQTSRDQQQAAATQAQADAEQAQLDARLSKVINDRWLEGVWVLNEADASTCATSAAARFQSGHVLAGGLGTGRWSLSGTQLHLVGTAQGQSMNDGYTFTAADAVSATAGVDDSDGYISLRRCTPAEMQAAPERGAPPVDVVTDQDPR